MNIFCENIVICYCNILKGYMLLGIGSEMFGGVWNVYMYNCMVFDFVFCFFFVKINYCCGGFIENIWMKNVKVGKM